MDSPLRPLAFSHLGLVIERPDTNFEEFLFFFKVLFMVDSQLLKISFYPFNVKYEITIHKILDIFYYLFSIPLTPTLKAP